MLTLFYTLTQLKPATELFNELIKEHTIAKKNFNDFNICISIQLVSFVIYFIFHI